jgi:hypothetical protein
MVDAGFYVVSCLKKNTYMRYIYNGPVARRSGAPKKYDGQIKPIELRPDVFTVCAKANDESWVAYQAVVHIRSWKRKAIVAKKAHTLKFMVLTTVNKEIKYLSRVYRGTNHDYSIFKKEFPGAEARCMEDFQIHVDLGCLGIEKDYPL